MISLHNDSCSSQHQHKQRDHAKSKAEVLHATLHASRLNYPLLCSRSGSPDGSTQNSYPSTFLSFTLFPSAATTSTQRARARPEEFSAIVAPLQPFRFSRVNDRAPVSAYFARALILPSSGDSTTMAFSDFLLRGLGQALAATPAVIFGAVSASCAGTTDLLTSI